MKRIILIIVAAAVVGTSAGLLFPVPAARAQTDGSGWAIFGEMVSEWAATIAKWVKEELWPVLRDQAVKRVVDDLTDQIIDSIENGGTPLFIQDPLGELQRVGDISFDSFNNYLTNEAGVNLCAPFSAQLQLYFQTSYQKEPQFGLPPYCTFDEFRQSLSDTKHMIEKGGWVAFRQSLDPSNNFFGAALLVDQAYLKQTSERVRAKSDAINRNAGFSDVGKCTAWENDVTGARMSETDADTRAAILANRDKGCSNASGGSSVWRECIARYKEGMCVRRETLTPGSVVAQAATKGVLKDFEYAANVQSILSALINTALSKVFKSVSGTGGLLAARSTVRGESFNYQDYTGKTFKDQLDAVLQRMNGMKEDYYSIHNYLNTIQGKLALGNKEAIRAIALCESWYDSKKSGAKGEKINTYRFGYVRYKPQEGLFVTATLGELVKIPLNSPSPLFADSWPSLYPALPVPGISPDYPERDGYFVEMERMRSDAYKALNGPSGSDGIRQKLDAYIEQVKGIVTSPEDIRTAVISSLTSYTDDAGAVITPLEQYESASSTLITEYTASSTAFADRVLANAMKEYTEYTSEFTKVTSEALASNVSLSGPGQINGTSASLSRTLDLIIQALQVTPYGVRLNSQTGQFIQAGMGGVDSDNMFFCEERT